MMILNWLKWRIATRELSELERWKVEWETLRRWLAEFPDVAIALDHMQAGALGNGGRPSIFSLREKMRTQMHTRICGYEPWQDKSTADQVHIALIKNLRGQLTESVARIEDLERKLYAANIAKAGLVIEQKVIDEAKSDALHVFDQSCNHTKQAIDYFAAVLYANCHPASVADIDLKNVNGVYRTGDQSVGIKFTSTRSASQFEREINAIRASTTQVTQATNKEQQ